MNLEKILKWFFRVAFHTLLYVFIYLSAVFSLIWANNKFLSYSCVILFIGLILWRDLILRSEDI